MIAAFVEVVTAEITIGLAGREDVKSGDGDLVGDGPSGAAGSATRLEAMVFVAQVGVLGARGADRGGVLR